MKQVQFTNPPPLTLRPTTCSTDYLEVGFIKGRWGSRRGLAESPHQAILQEGKLNWTFLAMVYLVLFFWQVGSFSIWFYPSWHRWSVWIKDHLQTLVRSQLLGLVSPGSWLARKLRGAGQVHGLLSLPSFSHQRTSSEAME